MALLVSKNVLKLWQTQWLCESAGINAQAVHSWLLNRQITNKHSQFIILKLATTKEIKFQVNTAKYSLINETANFFEISGNNRRICNF